MINVYTPLSENKEEKRAEIVWFGFSSPRGAFRLKTTLHGGGGVLMLMVDKSTFGWNGLLNDYQVRVSVPRLANKKRSQLIS